ncbi:F-box/kelch-repeat protein At3g06240-like [Vicia villosa]|uniref:F-box/kelch-repeat protein At3g06240-like n=1 Tax=Vicia villosa TaxID=3911 RepID=UPI00273CB0CB|nr:F-box/kelch-repeat protein At3g06240-like [Vicia villosa]
MENSVFLPFELIIEILLRLPVKPLLHFRCVCKSWLSLISSNTFATSHFEHAATHRRLLIKRSALQPLSIDVDSSFHDASACASLSLDFIRSQRCVEVRGCFRGFLCFYNDKHIYLLNPSTGLIKQIPDSPILLNHRYELLSGFVYYQPTDDYLIVSGFSEYDDPVPRPIKLMIFSLRANKWKPIEVASHLPYMETSVSEFTPKCGLFLNGSIHWMVHNYEKSKNVIIGFDIKEMTISEIALPDDFILSYSRNHSIYYDLLEVGGLINAWVKDLNTVKIWVMQKYGVHSSWTKIIQFSIDPVLHKSLLDIVCLTKCGDIVGINDVDGLVKLNDKGQLLESLLFDGYALVVYTESLFSLPSTGQT